jgi:flagellar M-ring protein FliF
MNALSEFGKQIAKLFETMTPSARIMAGLMVGVIVISLGWIFNSQQSAPGYHYLFGGRNFSDADLDMMEAAFSDTGLREFDRVGSRIRVPAEQKDAYLKALSAGDALPKEWGGIMDAALKDQSPWDSNWQRETGVQFAKEREVSNLIRRMPGIEFAAVDYDEQRTGFARNTLRTCSVSVQAMRNSPLPVETLKMISKMVQAHFAGLSDATVTVTDLGGGQSYRGSENPLAAEENIYLKIQREFERAYTEKLAELLRNYGDIQLAVNVELDPRMVEDVEKLKLDPTAVTVSSNESRKDLENIKPAPAGQPGAASNGVANQPQSINGNVAGQSSNSKQSEAVEKRIVGHEATITRMAGLVPRKVSIAVGIPESYYQKVWQVRAMRANPDPKATPVPPTAAELTQLQTEIQGTVRAAVEGMPIGIREGDDRLPFVNVYSYTDIPLPEIAPPSMTEQATDWLADSWSTLALLAVVLVSLGMTFSWIRSQKPNETDGKFADGFGLDMPDLTDELSLSSSASEGLGSDDDALDGGKRKPTFDLSGGEIKEDLSTLIKENPDAAVNLLKAWIGEAV